MSKRTLTITQQGVESSPSPFLGGAMPERGGREAREREERIWRR
jgi:hypothetical protein